ncbi:MAG: 4Fe-4S binding protein [Lachnospiraceae bacterium]|nr:4Fe-4S binding protein [Lachnospiraceae bacterium]
MIPEEEKIYQTNHLCSGCGKCLVVCPQKCILVDRVASIRTSDCTKCGECYHICPHDAIDYE